MDRKLFLILWLCTGLCKFVYGADLESGNNNIFLQFQLPQSPQDHSPEESDSDSDPEIHYSPRDSQHYNQQNLYQCQRVGNCIVMLSCFGFIYSGYNIFGCHQSIDTCVIGISSLFLSIMATAYGCCLSFEPRL